MRRLLSTVVVLVAIVATGCGGDLAANGPDCDAHFTWDGIEYDGLGSPRQAVAVGARLGDGIIRGCRDQPESAFAIYRLDSIDPSIAFAGRLDPSSRRIELYGRPGYIVESPRHPLHDAVYVSADKPDGTVGYRCGAPRTMRVRVVDAVAPGANPLKLTATRAADRNFLRKGRVQGYVRIDAHTKFTGADRHEIPFVETGDRLRIVLRGCRGTEEASAAMKGGRLIVVDSLRQLAPNR